jgi:predicted dehydrogenase
MKDSRPHNPAEGDFNEMQPDRHPNRISRRSVLKSLIGLPFAGVLGYGAFRKRMVDNEIKSLISKELSLGDLKIPEMLYGTTSGNDELIRIGIIGFGRRARHLASALGYLHPDELERKKANGSLADYLAHEPLNVEIVAICDVFDLHAENGLIICTNNIRPGQLKTKPSVKRYMRYQDLLADPLIDAVIIATPDHHHAQMAIDAARAGKHVYLEKSVAHGVEELEILYQTIKNSNIVFQLGHQITQNTVFQQAKEIIRNNLLGKISLIETTSNRNTQEEAWIRHLAPDGGFNPGDTDSIDWKQWLGNTPFVPFNVDRFYNWTKWFAYGTGLIGQLFTHEYDAINQLLNIGIPESVITSGGIYYWKDNREIPDTLHTVLEYSDKELTLLYSATLSSSRNRGRVLMGHDASMELGDNVRIKVDKNSTRFRDGIRAGLIDTSFPIISFNPNLGKVDAITSASEKYYADRGLMSTTVNGVPIDVTHLHLREWLTCIRKNSVPSCNIDKAYQVGITCLMAHKSYMEKRQVYWDSTKRRMV